MSARRAKRNPRLISILVIMMGFLFLAPLFSVPASATPVPDAPSPAAPADETQDPEPAAPAPGAGAEAPECEPGNSVDGQCLDAPEVSAPAGGLTAEDCTVNNAGISPVTGTAYDSQVRECQEEGQAVTEDPSSGSIGEKIMEAVGKFVFSGFMMLFDNLMGMMDGDGINPTIDCEQTSGGSCDPWFVSQLALMAQFGFWILIPLMLIVIIQAVFKGSMFMLARSFFVMLPVAILGTIFISGVAQMLLQIADRMTEFVIQNGGMGLANRERVVEGLLALGEGSFDLFTLLMFVVAALAALVIFIELILREVGIYLTVLFLPLCFAGLVWPSSSKWAKRLIEIAIGLIFSKVFIAMAISLGFAAIAGAGDITEAGGQLGFYHVTYTAAMLIFAAVIPMKVLSFVPGGSSAMEGRTSSPGAIWGKGEGAGMAAGKFAAWRQRRAGSVTPNVGAAFNNVGGGGGGGSGRAGGGDGSPWGPRSDRTPQTGGPSEQRGANSWNSASRGSGRGGSGSGSGGGSGSAPPPPERSAPDFAGGAGTSSGESGQGSRPSKPAPDFARGRGTGARPRRQAPPPPNPKKRPF